MMNGTPGSRASRVSRTTTSAGTGGFRCNRCIKPISATIFVCACDCVFCEECTYDHFNSSSTCPSCSRVLTPTDFLQLDLSQSSSAIAVGSQETLKNAFQSVFTKSSTNPGHCVTSQDMCSRYMKSMEEQKRIGRFLMKQFMVQAKQASKQMGLLGRAVQQLKQQNMILQQQKQQTDQAYAQLQLRNQDMERQLQQFRDLYAREGLARIPPSAHSSTGSHGSRGSRGGSAGERPDPHAAPPPPLQAFILQKQARERALLQEQNEAMMTQTRGIIPRPDVDSVITPIQALPPPPNNNKGRHVVRASIGSFPTPTAGTASHQLHFSHQRKRSHGTAMAGGGGSMRQRPNPPFGQPPPPGSSSYQYSTSRRSR